MDLETGPSQEQDGGGEVVTETQPQSEDDLLGAAYDKLTAPEDDEATDSPADSAAPEGEPSAEPETDAEPVEAAPQIEAPSNLPHALKERWADIPEDVRDIISAQQKEYVDEKAHMGRQIASLDPIRAAVEEAAQYYPELRSMKSSDVAAQIPALVAAGQQLRSDPVNALINLAEQHGVTETLAQIYSGGEGGANTAHLLEHIARLENQVQSMANPESLRAQMDDFYTERTMQNEIEEFAASAGHWAEVESHLPLTIPVVKAKMPEGTPARAVLEAAYELAIQNFRPELATPAEPSPEATPQAADPAKAQKALKAKSVNVQGRATGTPKPMTEDEALAAAYDRAARA